MRRTLEARLYAFTGFATIAAAIVVVLVCLEFEMRFTREEAWFALILFSVFALAARFPLHMAVRYQQELTPTPGVATALLLPPPLAIAVCALGHLSVAVKRPKDTPARNMFNTSTVILQATGASVVTRVVAGRFPLDSFEGGVLAISGAVAVWFIVGAIVLECAVAIQNLQIPGRNWFDRHAQTSTIEFSLLIVGGLAALIADVRPWLLPFMAIPIIVVYRAFSNQRLDLHRAQENVAFAEHGRRAAERARERFAAIVDTTPDVVLTLDYRSKIQYANPASRKLLGIANDEDVRKVPIERIFPEWKRSAIGATSGGSWSGETEIRTPDGSVPVSQVVIVHMGSDGSVDFISTVARDIRDRKAYERELVVLAENDALTGAYNRRRFEEEVEKALQHSLRSRRTGAVVYLDLDGFKSVNDSFGHQAGDRLLQAMVATLRAHPPIRDHGTIGRLGGDEFALLFRDMSESQASLLTQDILRLIESLRIKVREGHAAVTASVGVALFNGNSSRDDVLARADSAMYAAKTVGNRMVFGDPPVQRRSA